MKSLIIIDSEIKDAFEKSVAVEKKIKGDWVYFDFSDGKTAKGIYQLSPNEDMESEPSNGLLKVHDDFLDYLLGLFTPSLQTNFSLKQEKSFKDFCVLLNELLLNDNTVFDLSRHSFWIMHASNNNTDIKIGDKLKQYLDFI